MPDMAALKKRMSFGHKLPKFGRRDKDKQPKDTKDENQQQSSATSNASTASEASNATATTASTAPPAGTSLGPSLPPTRERYCTLRLSDDLAITIGDSFEPNPKSTLEDAWDFQYGSIRWPKFLRLLLLFPAVNPGEPLETLLFHADLHEVPFQMLKYEEGYAYRTMHVNGMKKSVHEGLYDALLAVRERACGRAFTVLWVDELCVNQDDPHECHAHTRLKRDIVAACTGKTAVDSALNANFKRGRRSRRSAEADRAEESSSQLTPARATRPRNLSNASDLSGSTEIISSKWQSRAQSVASMRTTERIRAGSDSDGSDSDDGDDSSSAGDNDGDDEDDPKGKLPEKKKASPSRNRHRSPHRAKKRHEGDSQATPRISISFGPPPKQPASQPDETAAPEHAAKEKPYHVMKSQPLE